MLLLRALAACRELVLLTAPSSPPVLPPCSGGAANVGGARPASGVLLPPQLRGRANVATDDLSIFTKQTQDSAKRRSGGQGAAR